MSEIHIGDTGTIFRATIKNQDDEIENISTATTKQFIFCKPDKTLSTVTSSFYTDGSDGVLQYAAASGFLDQAAIWQMQANVVTPSGTWKSNIYEFRVFKNLE